MSMKHSKYNYYSWLNDDCYYYYCFYAKCDIMLWYNKLVLLLTVIIIHISMVMMMMMMMMNMVMMIVMIMMIIIIIVINISHIDIGSGW